MATAIDEALEVLKGTSPEYDGGLSNPAPMGAEVLCALGHPEAAIPWVEAYKPRLEQEPRERDRIDRNQWQEALGDPSRSGNWIAFFDRELSMASWPGVVRNWVPRLAPEMMAGATHGLIRAGHAVRSLSQKLTLPRAHELAQGLGYWAACYQELPSTPSDRDKGYLPKEALNQVRRSHTSDFEPGRLIFEQVMGLDDEPDFADAIDLVDTAGDISAFISQLTETFAGLYLKNDRFIIAYVHAVTSPSSLRHLAPYLDDEDVRAAARYAWQACASVYAWYAIKLSPDTSEVKPPAVGKDELIERAVAAGGAHSLKFTETCLREYEINPSPVYLAAAYDAAERLGPV